MRARAVRIAIVGAATLGAIAVALSWPRARGPSPTFAFDASPLDAALVADTSPSVVATEVDAATPTNDELDHDPPKGTCRASVPEGASFARVSDRAIAAAVVSGVNADPDAGVWRARDCRGDGFAFDAPSEDDPDASRGSFRVQRGRVLGRKMSVNVTVAVTKGYDETCHGFLALLRLDPDELVVEATRVASGCHAGILAHLDGKLVVVEPGPPSNTGESAAVVDGAYAILRPNDGELVLLATVPAFRSWGNGAFGDPNPFASFESEPVDVDGPTLRIEEHWTSEVVGEPDDGQARTAKVVRDYSYASGKMTRSPSSDPFPIH